MAEKTGIAWSRSTWSPWIGCTEVSVSAPDGDTTKGGGCDGCYARTLDARYRWGGATHWGTGVPRHRTSAEYWKKPLKWDLQAASEKLRGITWAGRAGFWPIFPSLCDPFDNEIADEWRADWWQLIRDTPAVTWLLLTKRIGLAASMLPPDWGRGYPNVWIGATMVNQFEATRDMPKLLAVKAQKRFISYEPALGPVDWPGFGARRSWCPICKAIVPDSLNDMHEARHGVSLADPFDPDRHCAAVYDLIHQVIVGGESDQMRADGTIHKARPFVIGWARDTMRQCRSAGVACFVKQMGSFATNREGVRHAFKERGGADPAEWPADLRVQEFPA